MKSRRDFFRSLSAAAAGIILPLTSAKAAPQRNDSLMNIAIQLWSLREIVQNDLRRTLENLSKMGFQGIEPYGFDGTFFGIQAQEFKNICKSLNLKIYSSHTGITSQNAELFAEKAALVGLEYLILPSMMGRPHATADDYRKVAEELNKIGEVCRRCNIRFGYHNHDFEFETIDGLVPYDILLQQTDSSQVDFQLDVFWMVKAGYEPKQYFDKHPGRFSTLHIKDMGKDGESCIVGNGIIDFTDLMKHSEKAGTKLLIYEQEHFTEGEPLHCAEQSLKYMQAYLTKI
jgi:sugar phosphate isomerase/epimerase